MPNYALLLEYDGTAFSGFQKQKNQELKTVQGNLENSLKIILREDIKIFVAGRTDSGVHAKGMITNFHTSKPIQNFYKICLGINAISNSDFSVHSITEVPENFHARFSCTEREYEYHIYNSKFNSPLLKNKAYFISKEINLEKISEIAKELEGIHDFASFTKKESLKNYDSTIRNIKKIKLIEDKELKGYFKISILGSGFLHNMIRISVGTILDISKGRLDKTISEILNSKDRNKAGITLPSYGLYFKKAYYKDFPEIEKMYKEIFKDE